VNDLGLTTLLVLVFAGSLSGLRAAGGLSAHFQGDNLLLACLGCDVATPVIDLTAYDFSVLVRGHRARGAFGVGRHSRCAYRVPVLGCILIDRTRCSPIAFSLLDRLTHPYLGGSG
jgi:hypothetical protein